MPQDEFSRYEKQAAAFVNYRTMHRAEMQAKTDIVKLAVCEVADVIKQFYTVRIASESNDDLSAHYALPSAQSLSSSMEQAVLLHLAGSGLLYQGVDNA